MEPIIRFESNAGLKIAEQMTSAYFYWKINESGSPNSTSRIQPLQKPQNHKVRTMLAEAQAARIMGRAPCCSKVGLHRGPWTPHEDMILRNYISIHGEGQWRHLPKRAGLLRCGKSCRLRWLNCLRPNIKRGNITPDEEDLIIRLHRLLGNRWSLIAGRLPGRTDNEIKNFWNTRISRKLRTAGIDPNTHKPMHPVPCAGKNVPTQFPESNNYVTNNIVEGSSSSEKSEGNERAEQESEATRQKHEHENEYEDSWPSDCCMEDLVQNNWSLENNDFQFLLMDGSLEQLDYAAHLKHYESAQVGDDWLY